MIGFVPLVYRHQSGLTALAKNVPDYWVALVRVRSTGGSSRKANGYRISLANRERNTQAGSQIAVAVDPTSGKLHGHDVILGSVQEQKPLSSV